MKTRINVVLAVGLMMALGPIMASAPPAEDRRSDGIVGQGDRYSQQILKTSALDGDGPASVAEERTLELMFLIWTIKNGPEDPK